MPREYSDGLRDRVLFWVGLGMCGLSIAAIAVAEAFMSASIHGRQGVITFYRTHGIGLLVWASIVAWTIGRRSRTLPSP